jgi:WD40 repeat protein
MPGNEIVVVEIASHDRPTTYYCPFGPMALAWSPNNKYLAAIGGNGDLCIWDTNTKKSLLPITRYPSNISIDMTSDGPKGAAIAWAPHNNHLVYGIWGIYNHVSYLKVLDALTTHVLTDLGYNEATSASWSPNGMYIAASTSFGGVQIFEASTGKAIYYYRGQDTNKHFEIYDIGYNCVAWSPREACIASSGLDNDVHLWQAVQ